MIWLTLFSGVSQGVRPFDWGDRELGSSGFNWVGSKPVC